MKERFFIITGAALYLAALTELAIKSNFLIGLIFLIASIYISFLGVRSDFENKAN